MTAEPLPDAFGAVAEALEQAGFTVDGVLSEGDTMLLLTAWDAARDCPCIAKVLGPAAAADSSAAERLRREGTLLRELRHPHLVPCYEVIETDTGPIVILETLTGQTLSRLVEGDFPDGMFTDDLTVLARQLVSALHYLHRSGYLHLDIKPSNIVANGGSAVLFDLSLARPAGACPPGIGTVQYMAPEQLAGGDLTAAADVWGLGATLFRAATGVRPYSSERTLQSPGPAFELLERDSLDGWMTTLIRSCLAPAPAERPTLAEVREQLDDYYEELVEAELARSDRSVTAASDPVSDE